jgi:spermidine synthase
MKPQILLAEAKTPDGARLTLHAHDGRYSIRVNGKELMNSATTASELSLGELAVEGLEASATPRILIGGLGFGYTLQGVLSKVGPHATVHVTELIPAVLDWNRTYLAELNGSLLTDPRVKILTEDVRSVIARSSGQPYDAIALDIDNGPSAMVQSGNAKVYDLRGIQRIAGVEARWARHYLVFGRRQIIRKPAFEQRLHGEGDSVEEACDREEHELHDLRRG